MQLWPAIDLRGGRCVRLLQGDFAEETIYGDPLEQAAAYAKAGAERLHVVDLDAARTGQPLNRELVIEIASVAGVPVQAGGGVRDEQAAAWLLERGIDRVVVGTAAVERPELVASFAARWPHRIVVGLDHRSATQPDGGTRREVAVHGWMGAGGIELGRALEQFEGLALAGVVVTDIARDGTGHGPDLDGLSFALAHTTLPVVASGGVGSADDLRVLAELSVCGRRLAGAIAGRALLSGALSLEEALAACAP